jgi:hypothetical protein
MKIDKTGDRAASVAVGFRKVGEVTCRLSAQAGTNIAVTDIPNLKRRGGK